MRAMFLAPALLLSVMTFAPASAAPIAPLSAPAVESPLIQAQYHRDRPRAASRYRAGHRYRTAPRDRHRYDRRPGDWSRRGCILVGPVWFCP